MPFETKLVRRLAVGLLLLGALGAGACKKGLPLVGRGSSAPPPREDALFLAEAPAVVPEELASEFDAMGIRRLYVAAASADGGGTGPSFPASAQLDPAAGRPRPDGGAGCRGRPADGPARGARRGLGRPVPPSSWPRRRAWAQVTGVHLHILPAPTDAPALAKALSVLKSRLKGLTVSVTLLAGAPEGTWEPLEGAADEALVFSFGRRPETADTFVREMSQEEAKAFPIPFRLLLVPGGYGVAGVGREGSSSRRRRDRQALGGPEPRLRLRGRPLQRSREHLQLQAAGRIREGEEPPVGGRRAGPVRPPSLRRPRAPRLDDLAVERAAPRGPGLPPRRRSARRPPERLPGDPRPPDGQALGAEPLRGAGGRDRDGAARSGCACRTPARRRASCRASGTRSRSGSKGASSPPSAPATSTATRSSPRPAT